jgi:hypothetical protein
VLGHRQYWLKSGMNETALPNLLNHLKLNLNDYRFPIATMAEMLLNQAVTEKVL